MKIHYHTIVLFSVFMIVVVLGSVFMYLYQQRVDAFVAAYAAQITVCGNITDETQCNQNAACQAIYGPVAPDSAVPEFKRCQRPPIRVAAQLQSESQVCQATGGEWYRNKLGSFCLCQQAGSGKTFDKAKGCVIK